MSALAALVYLDACRLRNAGRQLLRNPMRLALWGLLLFFVPWQIYARLAIFPRDPSYHQPTVQAPLAAALALGAILIALGYVLLGVSRGSIGAFSSPADARFLTASAIAPQLVVLWVQFRATGVLVQALLPRSGDLRGPGSLLRMIGSAISLLPPAILAIIAAAFRLPPPLIATAAGVGVLTTVVAFSHATAARLRERGAEQALLARS